MVHGGKVLLYVDSPTEVLESVSDLTQRRNDNVEEMSFVGTNTDTS